MISMNKKYRTRDGRAVRVLCLDRVGTQPVVALIKNWDNAESVHVFNTDGRFIPDALKQDNLDLIEIGPYEDFKIDEPVMVRDTTDDYWQPRYFAGVDAKGRPTAWDYGGTSWSSAHRCEWKFCRRPTEEELKK